MTHADELKSSGLKATLPRIRILEVFQTTAQRHMTAEDVYKALLVEGADIGLATVYRVLMQFEQAGILSRNHFESGKSVFELNEGTHHDHLVCLDCGVLRPRDREAPARRGAITRLRVAGSCLVVVRGVLQEELRAQTAQVERRSRSLRGSILASRAVARRSALYGSGRPSAFWWRSMNSR